MSKPAHPVFLTLSALFLVMLVRVPSASGQSPRDQLIAAMNAGNFQAAGEGFRALALSDRTPERQVSDDFQFALSCMAQLGQIAEMDAFREAVVAKHSENWRVLWAAAASIAAGEHTGYLVDGKFVRGELPKEEDKKAENKEAGDEAAGKLEKVDAFERDRARAMQWMADAMPRARRDRDRPLVAKFFLAFGQVILLGRMEVVDSEFVSAEAAWKLEFLTSLNSLPEYRSLDAATTEIDPGGPVKADGRPLFFGIPHGFLAAQSDGERWRYCLKEAREHDRSLRDEVFFQTAGFFHAQFGVQTLAFYGPALGRLLDLRTKEIDGGVLDLATLTEDETVTRLAIGVERFRMDDATNFIKLYQDIVKRTQPYYVKKALIQLAEIFENRKQYARAAAYWKTLIDRRDGDVGPWEARLAQIVAPWGRFEPTLSQPAGKRAEVYYRFRNGHSVQCEAHEIDVAALLADVEAYLESGPEKIDYSKTDIADIGRRLLDENQAKYLKKKVAAWASEIRPRSGHFDKTLRLKTPLSRPGAYLVKASMRGGNKSALVLWITDTAIVQKPLEGGQFFFVADANSGKPVPDADVRFFGWRQARASGGDYVVETKKFAAKTNASGQVIVPAENLPESYRWVVSAGTKNGRFALLGWETFAAADCSPVYDEVKAFMMTDRPVYRRGETVRYKFWIRRVSYAPAAESGAASEFAGKKFDVVVTDPGGKEIAKEEVVADEYGGIAGVFDPPADASDGVFGASVRLAGKDESLGRGTFTLGGEDGAEFTVELDAPAKPVKLGKPFRFSLLATYRGGAPTADAEVEYTVYRRRRGNLYPSRSWDWLYGPGYWWLPEAAPWLPGWENWGRCRPEVACNETDEPYDRTAPELVAKSRTTLDENGTVEVKIDTALTAALHPSENHEFLIEARVTDPMRKTVRVRSKVLVADRPVEALVWVNRGFAESGDQVRVQVLTTSADGTPSPRKGTLSLYRIRYDAAGKPSEAPVEKWPTTTDALGRARRTVDAGGPGQYRLAFDFLDPDLGRIEGGCLFTVVGGDDPSEYRFGPLSIVPKRSTYRPGEKVKLMITAAAPDSTVLLFVRPRGGVYEPPRLVRMEGRTAEVELESESSDVPNFFVEATTIADGAPTTQTRRIVVPPSNRVLKVALKPSATTYQPGEAATIGLTLQSEDGKPLRGTAVVAVFEKALEAVAPAVPSDIRARFWKWTRRHSVLGTSNLERIFYNLVPPGAARMENLGVFGDSASRTGGFDVDHGESLEPGPSPITGAPAASEAQATFSERFTGSDAAFWFSEVQTAADGTASVEFTMPETSTRWEIVSWGLAGGTRDPAGGTRDPAGGTQVGQTRRTVLARKNFIVSLQMPDFLVAGDRCALSAVLENYRNAPSDAVARLDIAGDAVAMRGSAATRSATVPPEEPKEVRWTLDAKRPGSALLQVKADANGGSENGESDVVDKPLHVSMDGLPRIEARGGFIGPDQKQERFELSLPEDWKPRAAESVVTVRAAGCLGGATAEAIPFLYDSSDAGTDQAVTRFLPALALQKALESLGADIRPIEEESPDATEAKTALPGAALLEATPADNPVFSAQAVAEAARKGLADLAAMQLDDGGWGWFVGSGAESDAWDTANVVAAFHAAKGYGLEVDPARVARGVEWLTRYEEEQVKRVRNYAYVPHRQPWKPGVDNTDAFVFSVLADQGHRSDDMAAFLHRDRERLTSFGLALYCHGLVSLRDKARLEAAVPSLWARLRTDKEQKSVWLAAPEERGRNRWYGNHMATQACFLRLLVRIDPGHKLVPKLVHYIMSHRAHGTYWNSTYDTALCVESAGGDPPQDERSRPVGRQSPHLDRRQFS